MTVDKALYCDKVTGNSMITTLGALFDVRNLVIYLLPLYNKVVLI